MIKNISAGSGINVQNAYSTWPTFYTSTSSNSLVGQVRYNGTTQHMEVYDGTTWLTMTSSYPTVELNGEVQSILQWARTKMAEEAELKALAEKHPALKDAIDALHKAEEQVKIVSALVQE